MITSMLVQIKYNRGVHFNERLRTWSIPDGKLTKSGFFGDGLFPDGSISFFRSDAGPAPTGVLDQGLDLLRFGHVGLLEEAISSDVVDCLDDFFALFGVAVA